MTLDNDSQSQEALNQTAPDPAQTPELGGDAGADLLALTAERDRLATEKADLYEQLLRRTAEFENFRRRAERERQETLEYASMETVKALLPVIDDFERALRVETADRDYAKGMELIHSRMADILKRHGLETISTEGKLFDPNLHHAIEMHETAEAADQSILGEFQRGYMFRGRLLRPALVKVAVRS
jgi:molecular chaperone GrpE